MLEREKEKVRDRETKRARVHIAQERELKKEREKKKKHFGERERVHEYLQFLKWNLVYMFIMIISRSSSILGTIEQFSTE